MEKQLKKTLSILIVVMMLVNVLAAMPITAGATVTKLSSKLTLSGTVTLTDLTKYTSKSSIATITASKGTKFTEASTKEMFKGFTNCTSIDLSNVTFSSTVDANSMFYGLTKLTSLTLPKITVKNAHDMFYNCSALTTLNLSNLNTKSCTSMAGMFYGCSKLSSIMTGTTFTSAQVTTMQIMFDGCASLTSLDISRFNTSNCGTMAYMFNGCSKLKTLTLGSGFTGGIYSISSLFEGCSSLETVDVSHIVTYSETIMTNVFKGCSKLSELNLSGFKDSSYPGAAADMFSDCIGLDKITVSDGFCITEDMMLTNAKDDYTGWANEEEPNTIVSGNNEYAAFSGAGVYVRSVGGTAEVHNAVAVAAVPADIFTDGNTEYWYCSECGKYFSDSACEHEIAQDDTVIPALVKAVLTPDTVDDVIARNNPGLVNQYIGARFLGFQKRQLANEEVKANSLRFVTEVSSEILNKLNSDDEYDYGYVFAAVKADGAADYNNLTIDNAKAHKYSCKGTTNTVSGEYGSTDFNSTSYKYITAAINDIPSPAKFAARFYVIYKGITYYVDYATSGETGVVFNTASYL